MGLVDGIHNLIKNKINRGLPTTNSFEQIKKLKPCTNLYITHATWIFVGIELQYFVNYFATTGLT